MAPIGTLDSVGRPSAPRQVSDGMPAAGSAELAKYQSQLAELVHCPSSTTQAGKARIEEVIEKIATLEARMKQAHAAKPAVPMPPPPVLPSDQVSGAAAERLRLDHRGAWLDVQA